MGFHPLLDSIAGKIRRFRSGLEGLEELTLGSEFHLFANEYNVKDLFIINELHSARGIRKIHLELANLEAGLQILHCVMFPDPRFDVPIFGVDIVSNQQGISAAIVDLSPVRLSLPNIISHYSTFHVYNFIKLDRSRKVSCYSKIN